MCSAKYIIKVACVAEAFHVVIANADTGQRIAASSLSFSNWHIRLFGNSIFNVSSDPSRSYNACLEESVNSCLMKVDKMVVERIKSISVDITGGSQTPLQLDSTFFYPQVDHDDNTKLVLLKNDIAVLVMHIIQQQIIRKK